MDWTDETPEPFALMAIESIFLFIILLFKIHIFLLSLSLSAYDAARGFVEICDSKSVWNVFLFCIQQK